jgi:hypothetical protein
VWAPGLSPIVPRKGPGNPLKTLLRMARLYLRNLTLRFKQDNLYVLLLTLEKDDEKT